MTGTAEQRSTRDGRDAAVRERLARYFRDEAREYCDRLLVLLGADPSPSPPQLVEAVSRVRAIRGAATMADLEAIASLAGRLERVLKSLHARRLAWTPTLASLLRTSAGDVLDLVESTGQGEERNARIAERARNAAAELARYDVGERSTAAGVVVPIARLFYDDGGPHVLFVPVTPQTEFEQQLRALARGAPGAPAAAAPRQEQARPGEREQARALQTRRTPTAPRGHELRALLGESVSRMSASFDDSEDDLIPIEDLLYSGRAALERARLLAGVIHQRGAENSRELIPELIDLLELATRN